MKNYTISTILCSMLVICMTSCNEDKFFELKRPQETQWVNTVTFDQGLVSTYYYLMWAPGYRGTPQMMDYVPSGVAQFLPGLGTSAASIEMYNRLFDQNFSHTNDIWQTSYRGITLCNTAIELDEAGGGNPFNLRVDGDDYTDNYVRQVGEYYFLRAFAYYNLLKLFAPPFEHGGANAGAYIPFKTKVPTSKEDIFAETLGTNAAIYAQVIADLEVAKTKLPEAFTSATMLPTYQVGRATRYAAQALLAKILFLTGDYTRAQAELDGVIAAAETQGRFSMDEPVEPFNKNVQTDIPRESIWEFDGGDPTVPGGSMYMYWGGQISLQDRDADDFGRGDGMSKNPGTQYTISYWALDKAGWMVDPLNGDFSLSDEAKNDKRFQQLYYYLLPYKAGGDPFLYETETKHSEVDKPQIYVDKYFRGGPGDGRYSKFPILRLADMYLIRSWTRWKSADFVGAASDLNKVWNRANPDNPERYNPSNVTHDAILAEYIKEMTAEGWTLDFFFATQTPIPAGDRTGVSPIAPPYSGWKWTIPVAERDLNPNL